MFWLCLESGNNVRGCAVYGLLWNMCPSPLQMRPTRTSLLDHSTISCLGNKADSSSDSKRTRFNPAVAVFNPEITKRKCTVPKCPDFRLVPKWHFSTIVVLIVSNIEILWNTLLCQDYYFLSKVWVRVPSNGHQLTLHVLWGGCIWCTLLFSHSV